MAIEITLPSLHAGQKRVWANRAKYNFLRCGRRWGKTKLFVTMAADAAIRGKFVGFFAPSHDKLNEPWRELLGILDPLIIASDRNKGTILLKGGGLIYFYIVNDNILAGRGKAFDLVLIDEAAFTKNGQMYMTWLQAIRPTMATRKNPTAWVASTPYGRDEDNFFYKLYLDEFEGQSETPLGFVEHYAPSKDNPLVTDDFLAEEKRATHPLVYQQEYEAEFVSFAGTSFFREDYLLEEGKPIAYPIRSMNVFAVIDTAVKTGSANDATAVSYWADTSLPYKPGLVCLDWDLVQIEGAMLEVWIPSVFKRLEELSEQCGSRRGYCAYIEDAQSGSILLQQCSYRGLPAFALPSTLTAAGKDMRAINASGPVYRGEVRWSEYAFDKRLPYKGITQNHLLDQVYKFRVGDKDAAKRSDDLLDTFTYAVAVALGGDEGIS